MRTLLHLYVKIVILAVKSVIKPPIIAHNVRPKIENIWLGIPVRYVVLANDLMEHLALHAVAHKDFN